MKSIFRENSSSCPALNIDNRPYSPSLAVPRSFSPMSGIQGYQDTGIPGYRDTRIQGYQDTGIPGYRDSRIQGYQDTGIPGYMGYQDIGIPEYRYTGGSRIQVPYRGYYRIQVYWLYIYILF